MGHKKSFPTGTRPLQNSIEISFRPKGFEKPVYEYLQWKPTAANIEKAGLLRKKIVQEIKVGVFNYAEHFPDSPRAEIREIGTFYDYAQRWLNSPRNDWGVKGTRKKYLSILNRVWVPTLYNMPINLISESDLDYALANAIEVFKLKYKREEGPSEATFNDWLTPLRGAFSEAVRDKAIARDKNPADDFENRRRNDTEADPFDADEVNLIIDHAYKRYGEMMGAWFEVGFFTGMRYPSEPAALLWEDIDFRKKELRISKSRTPTGEVQPFTKTRYNRTINLNSRALSALERLKKHTSLAGENVFVFDSGPVNSGNTQRKAWAYILKAEGIRFRPPYNVRHFFATFGLINGLNPAYMAKQLGHSKQEFFKTYATWIEKAAITTRQIELMEKAIHGTGLELEGDIKLCR